MTNHTMTKRTGNGRTHIFFDGQTYDTKQDKRRLENQLFRVYFLMKSGKWWTLSGLQRFVGGSEAGISARIRVLRKKRFGAFTIDRRRKTAGVWEYRLSGIKTHGSH